MLRRRAFLVHKTNTIAARLSKMLGLVVVAAVVVTVSFMGGTPGDAIAKPPGGGGTPEPTPPGTIYFQVQTASGAQTWGMNGDGKNKFQALPTGIFGTPSSLLYGASGRRWWLITQADGRVYNTIIQPDGTVQENINHPHIELYAVTVNPDFSLEWQPVCDSYGTFIFSPAKDGSFNGPRPDWAFVNQWSSEGNDLFVYSGGTDIRAAFVIEADGSTTLDLRNGYNSSSLCTVDGSTMTVGQSVEAGVVLGPELLTILPGVWPHDNTQDSHFNPDGQSVLCDVGELQLRAEATGATFWTATFYVVQGSEWSPLGGTIAFSEGSGGIWLMAANESGYNAPVKIHAAPNKPYSTSTDPRWAPDAGHLAYVETVGGQSPAIYRMKPDGSAIVNLTGDLPAGAEKWPYRWVSNNVAPAP
jgi:hypothetical protein